jgi:hypothetical protein
MVDYRDFVRRSDRGLNAPGLAEFLHFERILTSRGEPYNKLQLSLKELAEVLDVGGVILRTANGDRTTLELFGWTGLAIKENPNRSVDSNRWFSGAAYKLGKPLVVNDYPSHRSANLDYVASGTRSLAALPVKGGRGVIGAMLLFVDRSAHFNQPRVRFLTAAVGMIGLALENYFLERQRSSGSGRGDALSTSTSGIEANRGPNEFLDLDTIGRRLHIRNSVIRLTATEASLITLLSAHRGRVVSYEDILHAVWGPEYGVEREYVRVFVARLRKKLGNQPDESWTIKNIARIGYLLP